MNLLFVIDDYYGLFKLLICIVLIMNVKYLSTFFNKKIGLLTDKYSQNIDPMPYKMCIKSIINNNQTIEEIEQNKINNEKYKALINKIISEHLNLMELVEMFIFENFSFDIKKFEIIQKINREYSHYYQIIAMIYIIVELCTIIYYINMQLILLNILMITFNVLSIGPNILNDDFKLNNISDNTKKITGQCNNKQLKELKKNNKIEICFLQ